MEAVTGEKVIRVRLLRDINIANNIINIWESRKQTEDWATWATEHKDWNSMLEQARLEWQMLVLP